MDTTLRPMSTGELLDRTFGIYRRNFLLFLGIAAPAPFVALLIILLVSIANATPGGGLGTNDAVGILFGLILILLICALAGGFAISVAATIRAVAALHLSRPIGIRQAYAEVRGHFWRVIGVTFAAGGLVCLGSLLSYGAAFVLSALAFGAATAAAGLLGTTAFVVALIFTIVACIGGILLALTFPVRYSVAVPACVVEDIPVRQAIRRSVFLAGKSRNRVLTVYVLFSVLSSALWGCLAFLADLVSGLSRSPAFGNALQSLAFFLTMVVTLPLATVAMSLMYYDERVRKEGYDLQVMIAGLEAPKASAAAASL